MMIKLTLSLSNLSLKNSISLSVILLISINLFSQPAITSFSPQSGAVGTSVTISGSNFSSTPTDNIVFFGAVRAAVTSTTASTLTVTVPAGATYQPISVTVNNLTAYSNKPFIVTFNGAAPQFTSQSFEYAAHIDSVNSDIETTKYTIGDIDNDGRIDVITVDRLNNTMSVYRNTTTTGNITFASKIDFTTGQSPRAVSLGDIDGDGKLDAVVSNLNNNTVSVFKNTSPNGNISFAPKIDFSTATQPSVISITDIDKDGKPDLVVNTINLEGYVSVLRNISSGGTISFAPKIDLQSVGGSIEEIRTADIDGDGKLDVVLPNYSLSVLSIFRNTSSIGTISFAGKIDIGTFTNPDNIEIGDLNDDNKLDIVVGHISNTNVMVLKNVSTVGNITFQYNGSYNEGIAPSGFAISDLDGDSKPDLVVTNGLSSFSLYKNNTPSGNDISFNSGVTNSVAYNSEVSSADFDNDGKTDLAFNTGILRVTIWKNRTTSPQISSFSPASGGKGDTITIKGGNFNDIISVSFGGVPALSFNIVNSTTVESVIDTGASGDVIVKSANDSARIPGFIFTGPPMITSFNPTFGGTGDTITINGTNFTGSTSVRFGGTPATSFIISSPHLIKAVVDSGSSGNVSIVNSYGVGTLGGFIYYPPPTISSFTPTSGGEGTSVSITGTNFNGATSVSFGGLPVASYNVNSSTSITATVAAGVTGLIRVTTPGGVAISSNSFLFPRPTITSFTPTSGSPGSIMTINGTNFISNAANNIVFFGAVKANVIAATSTSLTVVVPTGVTYQSISVTVNNYTVHSRQPFIETFEDWNAGITPSSFVWKGAFLASEDPRNDYMFDIDGDGKSDIITRNDVTGTISVLRNTSLNGILSFAPKVDIAGGFGTYAVIKIGDLNSDGKPDITVVTMGGIVYILKNTSTIGNILFQNIGFYVGISSSYVEMQDFDGDGKVDLAVTSNDIYGLGSVTIYPNIGAEGAIAFGAGVKININNYPIAIQAMDFDSDGKSDIVVKNNTNGGLTIIRNLSSIDSFSFGPAQYFPVTGSYYCIADFDGDSKPDIASSGGSSFYILRNTTSNNIISFDSVINFSLNQTLYQITAGQLNGDGKPDVVITGEKKIFVCKNISSGGAISFDAPITYFTQITYNWTDCSAIGDLDGDGKPEIAVANGADYKVSVFRNQIGESIDSVCENYSTIISSNTTGSNYQWQLNTGNGFNNISNNANYSGIDSSHLQITHTPVVWNGYQYRCLVDGNNSSITNLVVSPLIIPVGSATSPPEVCTNDIFNLTFTGISNVPLNSTLEIWESVNGSPFALAFSGLYNADPYNMTIKEDSPSTRKYFFRIIPPTTIPCSFSNNSDTTTTEIAHLETPTITINGIIMTISNPNTAAIYTWQIQGAGGVWDDITPTTNGISYTPTISGTFRVKGVLSGCTQYSNAQTIVITGIVSPGNVNSTELTVYPNPSASDIVIKHPSTVKMSKIIFIDASGKKIKTIYPIRNSNKTYFNVNNLAAGIYTIIWSDGVRFFSRAILVR